MNETAIPIEHSVMDVEQFLSPVVNDAQKRDEEIASLAEHPGWVNLEKIVLSEIDRLNDRLHFENESMEQYGMRMYAAELATGRLKWLIQHVRNTEEAVAQQRSRNQ